MHRGPFSLERDLDRVWVATFLLVAVVVVVRSWNAFAFPILEADDGVRFVFCFEHDGLDLWTWRHHGYSCLLVNAITALASGAPLGLQPILYAASAGAVASVALSLFAARRFRIVVRSDLVRAALCLMIALAPHGHARLVAGAMWMNVNLALIAVLLALVPLPRSGRARAVELAVVALLTLSSPFSLAAVPLRLAQAWRSPADRGCHLSLVAVAVLYAVYITPDPSGVRDPVMLAGAFARMLVKRVVAETMLGGAAWPTLGTAVWPFAGLVIAWVSLGVPRLPASKRSVALGLVGIIVTTSAMVVVGRANLGMPDVWWGERYTFIQRISFHLLLGILLAHRFATSTIRRQRIAVAMGLLHAFALAVTSGELYETYRRDGEQVLTWAAAAESWQDDSPGERAPLRLRRPGEWSLQLR